MKIKAIITIGITVLILSSCSEDCKCIKLGRTDIIDLSKEEDFSKEWYLDYLDNREFEKSEEFVLIHRENIISEDIDENIDGLGFSKETTLIHRARAIRDTEDPYYFGYPPEFEFFLRYNGEPYTGCIIDANDESEIYKYYLEKGLLTRMQVLKLPHVNMDFNLETWELTHQDTLVKYEMKFKDGKPHGRLFSKEWNTDSNKLVLSMDGEFKNGLKHGKWRGFRGGDQIWEKNYSDGYLNGDYTTLQFEKSGPYRYTSTMYMNSVVSTKTWSWNNCISDNSKDSIYLTDVRIYKYKPTDISQTITRPVLSCDKTEYCFELATWGDCKWYDKSYARRTNNNDLNFYAGKAIPINNLFIDYSNFDKDVMSKNVDSEFLHLSGKDK